MGAHAVESKRRGGGRDYFGKIKEESLKYSNKNKGNAFNMATESFACTYFCNSFLKIFSWSTSLFLFGIELLLLQIKFAFEMFC